VVVAAPALMPIQPYLVSLKHQLFWYTKLTGAFKNGK
jgi:hypothetical protein